MKPRLDEPKLHDERGATLLEFALAAPILLGVMFMIVDIGFFFFRQHTVQFATREGVRLALVGGTVAGDDGNPLDREASIVTTIERHAGLAAIPTEQLTISIYPLDADYSDPSGWEGMRDPGQPGQVMRVTTQYRHRFLVPAFRDPGTGEDPVIEARATYKNEMFE